MPAMGQKGAIDKKKEHSLRLTRRNFLLGSGAAGLLTLGNTFGLAPYSFRVQELVLPISKMPPGHTLRLVQLSDLHIGVFHGYFRQVAEAVNALAPEVIVLTGDYLEKGRNISEVRTFLQLLRASSGIVAVQGNWEYWARLEGENLRRHFARVGVTLLINERQDLEVRGLPLSILGLDYPSSTDQTRHLRQLADQARINVVLSHVPAFAHELLDESADLILSGHTHGGQVRFPLVQPFYLPRFSGVYVEGLYRVGPAATPLYVNRGIGTSLVPARLFCPPEITLITLTAEKQGLEAGS
jgi:uncharacterized protein